MDILEKPKILFQSSWLKFLDSDQPLTDDDEDEEEMYEILQLNLKIMSNLSCTKTEDEFVKIPIIQSISSESTICTNQSLESPQSLLPALDVNNTYSPNMNSDVDESELQLLSPSSLVQTPQQTSTENISIVTENDEIREGSSNSLLNRSLSAPTTVPPMNSLRVVSFRSKSDANVIPMQPYYTKEEMAQMEDEHCRHMVQNANRNVFNSDLLSSPQPRRIWRPRTKKVIIMNDNEGVQNGTNENTWHEGEEEPSMVNIEGEVETDYSYPLPTSPPFCVWLGNLPAAAELADIQGYLHTIDIVAEDIRFGRVKRHWTCAYVDFYSREDMKKALLAIDCANARLFLGRQIKIDINEGIQVDRECAISVSDSNSSINSPFRMLSSSSLNSSTSHMRSNSLKSDSSNDMRRYSLRNCSPDKSKIALIDTQYSANGRNNFGHGIKEYSNDVIAAPVVKDINVDMIATNTEYQTYDIVQDINHRNDDESFLGKSHSFQILKRPKSVSSLSSPKCNSSSSSTAGSVSNGSQDVRSRNSSSPDIPPSAVVQCSQKTDDFLPSASTKSRFPTNGNMINIYGCYHKHQNAYKYNYDRKSTAFYDTNIDYNKNFKRWQKRSPYNKYASEKQSFKNSISSQSLCRTYKSYRETVSNTDSYSAVQSYAVNGNGRRHLRSQKHHMLNYNGSKHVNGYSLNGMRNGAFYNSSSSSKFEKKNNWNHRGSGPRKYFF